MLSEYIPMAPTLVCAHARRVIGARVRFATALRPTLRETDHETVERLLADPAFRNCS